MDPKKLPRAYKWLEAIFGWIALFAIFMVYGTSLGNTVIDLLPYTLPSSFLLALVVKIFLLK